MISGTSGNFEGGCEASGEAADIVESMLAEDLWRVRGRGSVVEMDFVGRASCKAALHAVYRVMNTRRNALEGGSSLCRANG